ncbi:hypothetical protein SLEP1_g41585 [Rubroshorea leprosula]|uniref:Uncharacterized protein n=1 Tax=Rubroshorea leprosula TaxID=152421 RepID=A0AAV5L7A9_9ROSI|nr:hypothetical protein SLEP1_g41585 [Rubroshorea leprosula]
MSNTIIYQIIPNKESIRDLYHLHLEGDSDLGLAVLETDLEVRLAILLGERLSRRLVELLVFSPGGGDTLLE